MGYQLALWFGRNPHEQLHILVPWIVISIAGLSGLESLFLGEAATKLTGFAPGRAYQRQSGMNNLALALTALLVLLFNWGTYAELAVLSTLLIFLLLSSCNHAWTALREHNRAIKNFFRPIMTIALIVIVLPFIIRAIRYLR